MKTLLLAVSLFIGVSCLHAQDKDFFNGEYWRKQALVDVLPHWSSKGIDSVNGMFFTNLAREWKQFGSFDQSPAMIARHLFAYAAGYLMSGDEQLLIRAKQLLGYLDKNAWDKDFGGWYDQLDRDGNPVKLSKTTFNQVYCITGLTMYYFVTKDSTVLKTIEQANELLESKVWDSVGGGYYDVMNPDWTIQSSGKSFSSEITPVSGYLFYLYLATRDSRYLEQLRKIMNVVGDKMIDPATGWVLESFDSSWKYNYPSGNYEINVGHNIETAWMYLRLYRITEEKKYLDEAKKLDTRIAKFGYQAANGCWYANVARSDSGKHPDLSYWWIQAYGNMYNLIWYSLDQQKSRLTDFEKGAAFWDKYFVDSQYGEIFQGVTTAGDPIDPVKGNFFKASYHNLENSLLVWLYLDLWIKQKAVKLYFKLENNDRPILYPLPVEENNYRIKEIKFNGKKIRAKKTIPISLPGNSGKVEIELSTK